MLRALTIVTLSCVLVGCAQPSEPSFDAGSDSGTASGGVTDELTRAAAPLHLLPALFGDEATGTVVFTEARVEGLGRGLLILRGPAITASSGSVDDLVLLDESVEGGELHPAYASGVEMPELPAELADVVTDWDRLDVVDASVEGLALAGFEQGWLVSDVVTPVSAPIVVDARGFYWEGPTSRIVREMAEPAARQHVPGAVGFVGGARRSGSSDAPRRVVVDRGPAELGEPCESTAECTDGAVCVEPLVVEPTGGTDPGPVCAAECVDTSTSPDVLRCVDDQSCCSDALVCMADGRCIVPSSGDGGGSGGSSVSGENGPCGDRDDDEVCNAWDANPDSSCRHDGDGDGCNDSFDDSPDDPCNCLMAVPRPNSTGFFLLALAFLRGRARARRRGR